MGSVESALEKPCSIIRSFYTMYQSAVAREALAGDGARSAACVERLSFVHRHMPLAFGVRYLAIMEKSERVLERNVIHSHSYSVFGI